MLCKKCLENIPMIDEGDSNCKKCSVPLHGADTELCFQCVDQEYHFDRNTSFFSYRHPLIKEMLRLYKFESVKSMAHDFSLLLKEPVEDYFKTRSSKLPVPVPLSPLSKWQRGFNQVEVLLKKLKIDFIPALARKNHKSHQSLMNLTQRRAFIRGQFHVRNKLVKAIRGRDIVLIDDIYTTGSTADECARVLLKNGVRSVEVLTFFRS